VGIPPDATKHQHEIQVDPLGGHFHANITARKILQDGIWWPKLHRYYQAKVNKCDKC
jgi:hypothetical protein